MLTGRAGMDARVAEINRKRAAEAVLHKDDGREEEPWHAHARGYVEGMRRHRRDDDDDEDRDDQDEDERPSDVAGKGSKKLLAEFRDGMARHEQQHEELMHRLNPLFAACPDEDVTILPASQPLNPGPFEMVDPCRPVGKAYRDAFPLGPGDSPAPSAAPHPRSLGFGPPGSAHGGWSRPSTRGLDRPLSDGDT